MKEIEIYVPSRQNDGKLVQLADIERIKSLLINKFGGYTHFEQRAKGAWSIAGFTFHDAVTIMRVLDDGSVGLDMAKLKRFLERTLKQESVLIIAREVSLVA